MDKVRQKTNNIFVERLPQYEKEIKEEILHTLSGFKEFAPESVTFEQAIEAYEQMRTISIRYKYEQLYDRVFLEEHR